MSIEQRQQLAEEYFLQGFNCCQAVMMAFRDITGLDETTTLKVASAFGGGIARMREVCGTVSAMAMICGFLVPATDPESNSVKKDNYALMQKFAERFREGKGSIICRELLGLRQGADKPVPSERTPEYYRTRPCAALVGYSARILAEYLDNPASFGEK
ncbi:MAG: C_GCAxxG_C_C family protein [Bacteroidales bacterium]|nr:C_GCAxxG_C_C family protein [Bacteroidales bacterium]